MGNLELMTPDRSTGLWVFWGNTDPAPTRAGPPSGAWSGGLRVATGRRWAAVCLVQSRRGPDFLEAVAADAGMVQRLYWSPGAGFRLAEVLRRDASGAPGLAEQRGSATVLHALIPVGDVAVHVIADPSRYPRLRWRESAVVRPGLGTLRQAVLAAAPDGRGVLAALCDGEQAALARWAGGWAAPQVLPGSWTTVGAAIDPTGVAHFAGSDQDGRLLVGRGAPGTEIGDWGVLPDAAEGGLEAVALAATTLADSPLVLVTRRHGELFERRAAPNGSWGPPRPVVSTVWTTAGSGTVHRH